MGDEGGLVALAAVRDGGEEGGVGFYEDSGGGSEDGGLADGGGTGIGDVSCEGEVEAGGDGAVCLIDVAGEAVHDAAELERYPVLLDEGEEVFPGGIGAAEGLEFLLGGGGGELGGAAVDEDGFACGGGDGHLGDEGGLLDVWEGVVEMVVVEANLTDGDAAWVGGEGGEPGEGFGGGAGGLLRVDADAGEDAGERGRVGGVGDVECAVHGVRAVADADGEDGLDSGGTGTGEDGFKVVGVGVEVGVRVDEGHGFTTRILHGRLIEDDESVRKRGWEQENGTAS